jgi:DNA-binding NarL/FixJ family response regulator
VTRSTRPARVLIADDHTLFREGLTELCALEPDLHVVGGASDGAGAVELARLEHPEVVLLDVEMPGQPVEETVRQLSAIDRRTHVVILTMHEDARVLRKLLSIGVDAYISKGATRRELLAAIRAVRDDQAKVVLSVPKGTMDQLANLAEGPLSARELDVVALVADGLSNADIAAALYISLGTVKRHLTNVYLKLNVHSRTNAVSRAATLGLLKDR